MESTVQPLSVSEVVARYDAEAIEYFNRTIDADISATLNRFTHYIPAGGFIVDAGCGSGRDTAWFLERCFQVYAYDASRELVKLANQHLGKSDFVQCHTHVELELLQPVDGIFACSSMLFLNDADLAEALKVFRWAIKPDGVLFTQFKTGSGWREANDRVFRDVKPEEVDSLFANTGFSVAEVWLDIDSLGRGNNWTSCMLRRL